MRTPTRRPNDGTYFFDDGEDPGLVVIVSVRSDA